jgi:hypothetical protein
MVTTVSSIITYWPQSRQWPLYLQQLLCEEITFIEIGRSEHQSSFVCNYIYSFHLYRKAFNYGTIAQRFVITVPLVSSSINMNVASYLHSHLVRPDPQHSVNTCHHSFNINISDKQDVLWARSDWFWGCNDRTISFGEIWDLCFALNSLVHSCHISILHSPNPVSIEVLKTR